MANNPNITTIKLSRETKARVDKLRVYQRETYDEIIQDILNTLSLCRLNPNAARIKLLGIDAKKRKANKKQEKIHKTKIQIP